MIARASLANIAAFIPFAALLVAGVAFGMALDLPRFLSPAQFKALVADTPVVIRVRDLKAAANWYEEKLGLTRIIAWPAKASGDERPSKIVLLRDGTRVELIQRGSSIDTPGVQGRGRPVAFPVSDVDAFVEELRAAGVTGIEEPRFTRSRAGLRVSRMRDLEGQVIELQQPL